MNLLQEIREGFATVPPGKALEIKSLSKSAPAWIIRERDWYGTAVEYISDEAVSEKFASVRIWSGTWTIDGVEKKLLLLTSQKDALRYEFASICAEFCEPGENNWQRQQLTENPVDWWLRWRELLGNKISSQKVYDVLAEMIVYSTLLQSDPGATWTALSHATHDLVSGKKSIEVKSTLKRYESIVTINSQYQLEPDNETLSIVFCRFEFSPKGYSIDSVAEKLKAQGCSSTDIESGLASLGFENGSSARKETFKLLEAIEYPVDDNFPKITKASFPGNQLPAGIEAITYDVNLSQVTNRKPFIAISG